MPERSSVSGGVDGPNGRGEETDLGHQEHGGVLEPRVGVGPATVAGKGVHLHLPLPPRRIDSMGHESAMQTSQKVT